MARMDLKRNFAIAVLLVLYMPAVFNEQDVPDDCPTRKENPKGQTCQKACAQDQDCPRKKQRCLCDGECGMSCITARSTCPWPVTIDNADTALIQETKNFGDQMTVRCQPGFKMASGLEMAHSRCQGDKKWSVTASCDAVSPCGDPPGIDNGYLGKDGNAVKGLTAQYKCNRGFRLEGPEVIECLQNQTWSWSNPVPVCKKIYCPPPPEIKEGILVAVKKQEYEISEVTYYMCKRNFLMDGSHSITCLDNGQWSEPPACRARCKVPVQRSKVIYKGRKVWVTEIEEGLVHHSETVDFFCKNATEACSYTAATKCFDGVLPLPDCYEEPTWVQYHIFPKKLVSEIAECQER
ncbi:beta-2-glycoprotein 1-like [Hyperolius riggenbachi]|uniref:beta-2-glycoprotein 1-like n=1 Tax=Hyperolius riggenbachi TaxID=752182 RepID=UPI0035A3CB95